MHPEENSPGSPPETPPHRHVPTHQTGPTDQQNRGRRRQPGQPHIILCGAREQREEVVALLEEQGVTLSPYVEASMPPPLYRFDYDRKLEPWKPQGTFDDIGSASALYTFDLRRLGEGASANARDNDELVQWLVGEVLRANHRHHDDRADVHACLDRIVAGPTAGPTTGPAISPDEEPGISPDEEPGISPGGTPRWLDQLSSAAAKAIDWRGGLPLKELRNTKGGDDTAIIILDTSPPDLDTWQPEDRIVDGWADFNSLLLRDPARQKAFNRELREQALRLSTTKKMVGDRLEGVKHHGLIVATICRDLAPSHTQLFLMRVQDDEGLGTIYALCSAMRYALHLREQGKLPRRLIFNLSLGIPATARSGIDSHHLLRTIDDVLGEENTFVVAAAGNTGAMGQQRVEAEEPAAYANIVHELALTTPEEPQHELPFEPGSWQRYHRRMLCIGASDRSDYTRQRYPLAYAPFSNRAELVAPGMNLVLRTRENGRDRFVMWSGTSFATPQVSALIAQMLAAGAEIDAIEEILKSTGEEGPGRSICQIQPAQALNMARRSHEAA